LLFVVIPGRAETLLMSEIRYARQRNVRRDIVTIVQAIEQDPPLGAARIRLKECSHKPNPANVGGWPRWLILPRTRKQT
jgi:hypothetical protein